MNIPDSCHCSRYQILRKWSPASCQRHKYESGRRKYFGAEACSRRLIDLDSLDPNYKGVLGGYGYRRRDFFEQSREKQKANLGERISPARRALRDSILRA